MQGCQELCDAIAKGYKGKEDGGKATIAVVEFSDLSGAVTNLGRFLAEELITDLLATGKYKVVDRSQLNKVIREHRLRLQGWWTRSLRKNWESFSAWTPSFPGVSLRLETAAGSMPG